MSSPAETEPVAEPEAIKNAALWGVLVNGVLLGIIALVAWATDTWISAAASVSVNFVVFLIHALPQSSEKFFDATGTLTYLTLMISGLLFSPSFASRDFSSFGTRQLVLAGMVCIWAVRLGSYLLGRICKDGNDHRFDRVKSNCVLWLAVWSYQALWCFLVALPVLIILSNADCAPVGIWDIAGWTIWVLAFGFEVVSDRQKDAFRRDPANKGRFITVGLWSRSRHPNYFGEISLWVGITVSGMSCFRGLDFLAWISPVTTFILLMFISGVPLLEKTGEERWGTEAAYRHYVDNTPVLVPRLTAPPPFNEAKADGVQLVDA